MSKNIKNLTLWSIYSKDNVPYYYKEVNITFSGGNQGASGPQIFKCKFQRIGNIVHFTYPLVYQGEQSENYISTSIIPFEFRPASNQIITCSVIHGSNPGATATNAVVGGFCYVKTDGVIQWGSSLDNAGTLYKFGGAATSGSGNGLVAACLTYSI